MRISFYQTASGRSPIEDFIISLSKSDQARFAEVYRGILKYGFECPRVIFKVIDRKLWEIKFKAEGGSYRILYLTKDRQHIIWLHAFKKKSQKISKLDLSIAKKRMKDVL